MWFQLSTTCSNFTEVAQWEAPGCSHPQLATDNGVRDGRSNWLVAPPPYTRQYHMSSTYCTLQCGLGCKSQDLLHWVSRERATFGMPDQRTACAATQGIYFFTVYTYTSLFMAVVHDAKRPKYWSWIIHKLPYCGCARCTTAQNSDAKRKTLTS